MVSKKTRQRRILEMVRGSRIGSQQELSDLLGDKGIDVAQSTLSRDIRELGLVKVRGGYQTSGGEGVALPESAVRRTFEQFVIGSGVSGNLAMIKTSPGNAHSVGVVLDAAQWTEILGTVAGDDTVFVLLRSSRCGQKVLRRIRELSV